MRKVQSRASQARQRRKRPDELNWGLVVLLITLLVGVVLYLKYSPSQFPHMDRLRREGAVFYMAPPASVAALCYQMLDSLLGRRSPATGAVTTVKLRKDAVLAFVPNTLTLSFRNTALLSLRRELTTMHASNSSKGGELHSKPGLLTALAAIGELRDSKSKHYEWLQSLPRTFPNAQTFTSDQKAILRGTPAEHLMEILDTSVRELMSAKLDYFAKKPVTREEATWAVGLVTQIGLDNGQELVPGLLDGLGRNWDPSQCSDIVRNVMPTGKTPGWALLATGNMSAGERVWICTAEATNPQTLTHFGIAFPENTHGPIMYQNGVSEQIRAVASGLAERASCPRESVLALALKHNASAVLTDENVRCNSLIWMGDAEQSLAAMNVGYFAVWPRLESIAESNWLKAEAYFYSAVRDGCEKSLQTLRTSVDNATIERIRQDSHETSRHALLVRDQELSLHESCVNWTSSRIDLLLLSESYQDAPDPKAWPPVHEEL